MLLDRRRSVLLAIDIQERLLPAMTGGEGMLNATRTLIQAARRLEIPVLASEQYPKGLGPTVPDLARDLADGEVLTKTAFSCARDSGIAAGIGALQRRQLVLCGIEAHVCVLQTALGFAAAGYEVAVVRDAVTSRKQESVAAALDRLTLNGIPTPTKEMVLFEWLEEAATPEFKDLRGLIA
jgi:nicotinamidase-related amidase